MLLHRRDCNVQLLLTSTIAKLLSPQSGTIHFQGQMGFVFQNPDHQLVMPTVGADVAFGLVAERLSQVQIRNRVEDSLSAVNLLAIVLIFNVARMTLLAFFNRYFFI